MPGGASRTVHSSLLLSGECWWVSICKRQPGEGEPPNPPLIPHSSQGKGLEVQIQGPLLSVCVVCFSKLLDSHFIPLCNPEGGAKYSNELLMITLGTCWILGETWFLLSKLNYLSLQPRRGGSHSDTPSLETAVKSEGLNIHIPPFLLDFSTRKSGVGLIFL